MVVPAQGIWITFQCRRALTAIRPASSTSPARARAVAAFSSVGVEALQPNTASYGFEGLGSPVFVGLERSLGAVGWLGGAGERDGNSSRLLGWRETTEWALLMAGPRASSIGS